MLRGPSGPWFFGPVGQLKGVHVGSMHDKIIFKPYMNGDLFMKSNMFCRTRKRSLMLSDIGFKAFAELAQDTRISALRHKSYFSNISVLWIG